MDDVVVVSAVRTPFGRFGGSLAEVPTIDLGATVIREAVARSGLSSEQVDMVYMGLCMPTGGMAASRMAALKAGLALTTRSLTLDRVCCSAMSAIGLGMATLLAGQSEVLVAGGMENMSRTPFLMPQARWGNKIGDFTIEDPLVIRNPYLQEPMARYTGNTSLRYGVDRAMQDEWALQSHRRWSVAHQGGKFADELMPVPLKPARGEPKTLVQDEQPRPDTTLEKLASLPTIYGSPTVTAGNAPGLNDGATATLLMTAKRAAEQGLKPLGTVVSYAAICGEPDQSTRLPADAMQQALRRAGLGVDDLDLVEINEAFAATPLVSTLALADGDAAQLQRLRERTNINGGAVAIGHPVGASGARLVMTLMYELRRRGGGIGGAAICGGVGQADAVTVRV